jgi:FkbM family methyltransferase
MVQPYVPDYREPFFDRVLELLGQKGVQFEVLAAGARGVQRARHDGVHPGYAVTVAMTTLSLRGISIRWKHVLQRTRSSDLVVVELAAGAVESIIGTLTRRDRTALWGHGYAAVSDPNPLDSAIERWMMRRAVHVFVYTERGRVAAISAGADPRRITVINNSVDVAALRKRAQELSRSTALRILDRSDNSGGRCTAAAIGGLDTSKRVEFLIAAADRVRERMPEFELIVAGDGNQAPVVEKAAATRPWLSFIGRAGIEEKTAIGKVAGCLMNPGRVGLIAVDSFALGLPIVTTRWPYHAPEVEYLTDGVTAVFADNSIESFVDAVVGVLSDAKWRERLAAACHAAAEHYGIDEMARRFVEGVLASLPAQRDRPVARPSRPTPVAQIVDPIAEFSRKVMSRARRATFGTLIGALPTRPRGLVRLGTDYGGWWVPLDYIRPGAVAYCVGAGEDVSFDLELLARGCTVRTIDPTPRAIEYVRSLNLRTERFTFVPVGLGHPGRRRMYAPRDSRHVSHSLVNLQRTSNYIEVDVMTPGELMRRLGDDHIDLLKVDVEGAEYEVIEWLLRENVRPHVLCIEFDQPQPIRRSRRALRALQNVGYSLVHVEGFNSLLVWSGG